MKFSILKNAGLQLLLALMSNIAFAQYWLPMIPEVEEFKKRTLIVGLKEVTEKTEKSYKKDPKGLADHRTSVAEHNEFLKKHVPEMWPFKQEIIFKNMSEVEQIIKEKDTRYAILACRWIDELDVSRRRGIDKTTVTTTKFRGFAIYTFLAENGKNAMDTPTSMTVKRGNYIYKVTMPHNTINELDFKVVMAFFNEYINRVLTEGKEQKGSFLERNYYFLKHNPERAKLLEEKTLLIPFESLTIPASEVEKLYPYPYEIVKYDKYKDKLQSDEEGNYAYYRIVFNEEERKWSWFIIDNKDQKLLNIQTTYLPKSFLKKMGENMTRNELFPVVREETIVINDVQLKNLSEAIKGKK